MLSLDEDDYEALGWGSVQESSTPVFERILAQQKQAWREYRSTNTYRVAQKVRKTSERYKEVAKASSAAYRKTEAFKASQARYHQTEKYKEAHRRAARKHDAKRRAKKKALNELARTNSSPSDSSQG